ncbi:L,D-transpeptidase, partial [Aeromonas caviae]
MKLLRNSVATLCYSLLLTAAPVFAVEYALPAANSRLVGEN